MPLGSCDRLAEDVIDLEENSLSAVRDSGIISIGVLGWLLGCLLGL